MLERSFGGEACRVGGGCCTEVLEKGVGKECWGEVLQEEWCREELKKSVG